MNRDILVEMGYEDVTVFENPDFDSAIIGVSSDGQVVYSYSKMVEHLVKQDKMSYEEAEEFIAYNTIRALPYFKNAPIVMYDLEN